MGSLRISSGGSGLPSRVIFHGVEGVGKTSFGAFAPKPLFAMTRGETGLLTLIDAGRVPLTDHFDESASWGELLRAVNQLLGEDTGHRTLVLDTLNGAERLCFEAVCAERFDGDWAKFAAYGRGPDLAQGEWNGFLGLLDEVRAARRMAVLALCHTRVRPYSNPLGDNFDRFCPDMNDKTWGLAAKWADVVLFGNFEVQVRKLDNRAAKGKGVGGERRLLYTTRTAAFDAKNRLGLPAQIPMGVRPEEGWSNFLAAMRRNRPRPAAEPAAEPGARNGPATSPAEGAAPAPQAPDSAAGDDTNANDEAGEE